MTPGANPNQPKYCPRCHAVSEGYAPICRACGFDFNSQPPPPQQQYMHVVQPYQATSQHKPALAFILSALLPGAGQIYNRQYVKGVIFLVLLVGSGLFVPISIDWVMSHLGLLLFISAISLAVAYDALHIGNKIKRGQTVSPFEFF